ncbi:MAG TPA: RsmE family RNA methyltransferase [Myxococcota bacterium]|nr:RsmE family RNA methyltransferase [Myxococcota bacterium]HRY96672.1 RsmE family RNA methyltransferase [Myxococcota bacterium]HSA23641.1 RsmE family RNA methyltransferase [Myxococcota bacterium]
MRARIHIPAARLGPRIELRPGERHYLLDVLRLSAGQPLEVFDGQGGRAPARLEAQAGAAWLMLTGPVVRGALATRRVRLGVALLKGRKLDEVARMATELGVDALSPFVSLHCVARPAEEGRAGRLARLRTIAAEAARQCGRADVPRVDEVQPFARLLAGAPEEARVILDERGGGLLLPELLGEASDCLVLVGPEGGFAAEEVGQAEERGFLVGSLGTHVLRAETAGVMAAGLACLDTARALK